MKIVADRYALLEAARTAAKSAALTGKTMPELTGILLEADLHNYFLRLTSTNLETCVQTRLRDVKIEREGSTVINAELLCNMLKLLDGDTVSVETDDRLLVHVQSGNAQYAVASLPVDKFPKPGIPFPAETVKIVGLPRLIRQTLFAAASSDNGNASLQGVHLSFSGSSTIAAATDARRLAIAETEKCADGNLDVILHQRSLHVLNSVIHPNDELYAGIAGKSVVLFKEDFLFCARLMDGPFVDVDRMVESVDKSSGCICEAKELLAAFDSLNTVSRMSADRYVHLAIDKDRLELRTASEMGSSSQFVGAKDLLPTPAEGFYYFPDLILDFLKLASGAVEISISKQGFLLLTADGYKYLVIPRRKPVPKPEKKEKEKSEKTSKPKKSRAKAA